MPSSSAAASLIEQARRNGRGSLDEPAAKRVLSSYGLRVPRSAVVQSHDDVPRALDTLRGPLALKLISPDVLHKSDFGGVRLGLRQPGDIRACMDDMSARCGQAGYRLDGFLLEEQAAPGHEVVIGGLRDPSFGQVVMVGLGGVFVEVMRDVAFRVCPITPLDARDMLDELQGAALLRGARGQARVPDEIVIDALLAVGGENGLLTRNADSIAELDINPLIVSPDGAVAVDARLVLRSDAGSPCPDAHCESPGAAMPADFGPLFRPAAIAVAGVSSKSAGQGNKFIRRLRAAGYPGAVYPIHPVETRLEGLPAYPSLADTPRPVDYAFVAIPAEAVPPLLASARNRVRYAQVMSSGFGEGGRGGALRASLLQAARAGSMRLLGPNCMGIYSPSGRVNFTDGAMTEVGTVGVLSQSGGLSIDIVRSGEYRGLRFSGVVSLGNCLDVGAADLLQHYLDDPGTRVIGAYIEDIRDGRRFFELLRDARARKPVVLLKGGRTRQGQRAAASHTGSLAGNDQVWRALAAQTGSILADTMEEFIDALVALEHEDANAAAFDGRAILFGNGGGASVLAADALGRLGVDVPPLRPDTVCALERLGIPAGAGIENPLDVPANILQRDHGALARRILDTVAATERPGAIVMHLNLPVILGYREGELLDELVQAAVGLKAALPAGVRLFLVLRSTGQPHLEAKRQAHAALAMRAGIPVFLGLPAVARALAALRRHSLFRASRATAGEHPA